jgi:signal transduction histidine kinase
VSEARSIARGLHPVEIDSAGLTTALETLVTKKQWAVPVRFKRNGVLPIKDDTTALHLYRIASEAIFNANKHAAAREIIVSVSASKEEIVLSVTDDGKGINPRARKGMGLHIMDYRARSIGARLEIERIRPRGTRITCSLPRK